MSICDTADRQDKDCCIEICLLETQQFAKRRDKGINFSMKLRVYETPLEDRSRFERGI